jgi:NADAR domain
MGSLPVNCVPGSGLFWYHCGMAVTAAGARSVSELLGVIRDGGQAEYLLFWGHRPPEAGGAGPGCLSQWWPASFTSDGVAYLSAEHFMMAGKALLFGDIRTAERIRQAPDPVPLENRIAALTWVSRFSGGSLVFVDQAAEDRFSADPARAEVCSGDVGSGARVGDALVDALMCRAVL